MERAVRELVEDWQVVPDGSPWRTGPSTVLPVTTAEGRPAVLKVSAAADEHAHLALQHWHGRGAVQLLRADPRRGALLLERLGEPDLTDAWDVEACETVAGLYALLHVPAVPQLRPLTSYVDRWVAQLEELPRSAPVPRRLVEQATAIGRDLSSDPATLGRTLHGDLHYGNVLAADRAPWLAIDPRPVSGDPHYEVGPLLWHRFDELAGDVRGGVRRRFHAVVDAAGLDEARAREWVVLRAMVNAVEGMGRRLPAPHEDATLCVAIAKAVQD
ncbi:MAG TPA: aminoglycoside phosphotransferase family protein [Nocardioides sp.]|nr:aminoglycoside phosphotransferase family protein [Nocardioides sp.]